MKKIAFVFCALFAVSVVNAQVSANAGNKHREKNAQIHRYCARLKDGVLVMMEDDHEMTVDVTLPNGTQVKADGSVTHTDGTVVILEEGECVDEGGNISPSPGGKMKSKNQTGKKEDEMVPPGKKK